MGSGECFFCEIILFLRRDMFQCIQHRGAPSVCPIIHSGMMAGSLERKINVIKWTRHLPKKTYAIHMAYTYEHFFCPYCSDSVHPTIKMCVYVYSLPTST